MQELQAREGFAWDRHEANGLAVHVERGPLGVARAMMVADTALYARDLILEYVGEPEYAPMISVFVVSDRGRMADLIGRETNGTAYYTSNAVCVVQGEALLGRIAHELFHVIAMNTWGVPARWVNEGAAVDAESWIRGIDLHLLGRRLMERGELPSFRAITQRFGALPSERAYPAAGSVVRFIREAYGTDAVRALWEGGLRRLEAQTSTSADSLEERWMAIVEGQPASR